MPAPGLFRLQSARAMTALAGDWALITAAFAAALAWPHPLIYMLAAILIARSQLALAVMMHESAHGTLLARRWNDTIGQVFAAGPLFLSLKSYQAGHLKHHRTPMSADDPVAVVFGIADYPVSRRCLMLRLLGDLCGASYLASLFRIARGDYRHIMPKARKSSRWRVLEAASMLLTNGLLLALLAWRGHPWLYAGLWLLPAMTLLPLFGRVRAILEHAGLPATEDQSLNARTIVRPSWQTFVFGPHCIHYHIEHHLYPRLPFYSLRPVHAELAARGQIPTANLYEGYGRVLREVTQVH